jgi:single-strand DNA-binding protein
MASYHQTLIVGNLGRDPETRYLTSGDAVCNFSVAVTESWKDKSSGEKKEQTTWYRVNAFGKLAEICGKYLVKGSPVMIVGKMQARKWEKDGVERESWELRADTMQMLGGNRASTESREPEQQKQEPSKAPGGDMDDDVPF